MSQQEITADNWTFCHYKADKLKAFISFGASPGILDDSFIYWATIMDEEQNELHQSEFSEVNAACDFINKKYTNLWDFVDARTKKSEDGCSSCSAH